MNLLIVDDNPTNIKLLRAQLGVEGHAVFEARDGVEALAMLKRQPVDAVISDILMPRMDGYQLCREIRKHERLHELPIIIYTATYISPGDEKLALDMGADKYFKKPVPVATLIAALNKVIAQPRAAPRADDLLEVEVLKEYNERLVSRLKEKNTQLQTQTEVLTAEIAERKRAEARTLRLNRVYAVMSGINAIIVRVRERQELFTEVCRIAGEYGQFRMVWIGWLNPQEMTITPMAKAGFDDGYLEQIQLRIRGDMADEYVPVGQALREKSPVVCNDISIDMKMTCWHFQSAQRGYRSMAVFPLVVGNQAVGVFALYASETHFFDTAEIKLLSELAGNVSFALDYIEKAERLAYLAYYDVLTGLPSRLLFQDRFEQALNQAIRHETGVALLYLDLNDFKNINDSLGHNVGDLLLKQLATRLSAGMREEDTVARLGGDEFVVILAEVAAAEEVSPVAQKIIELIIEPFMVDKHELFVTCSVGIALYPKDGEDSETLLKNADAALYQAKNQGRNNAQFCTAEMNAKALARLTLENNLRQALKQEEFLLHYQPRVDLRSGQITGVEALVRWQPPGLPLVAPGAFIPTAEECGLIVPLGVWVLHTACAQNVAWQRAGLKPVCVAVNLSARQFRQQDLVAVVSRVLQETGLDPALLELELTESLVMQNVVATIETLTQLKAMGVKLSIDDFGTGYSSLSYLKRVPIDFLKIDQSFVRDITTNADDAAIVKTIISMSHDMELRVIAEGVETEAQESFLRLHDCDEMQGYLFSEPVPAEEIEVLLKSASILLP